ECQTLRVGQRAKGKGQRAKGKGQRAKGKGQRAKGKGMTISSSFPPFPKAKRLPSPGETRFRSAGFDEIE
ncbi:MAG: hypothetical protein AB1589_45395, partial [Cyanobacteriota bacterium]